MSTPKTTSTGIDLGSRLTKVVRAGPSAEILDSRMFDTGHDPLAHLRKILKGSGDEPTVATGYGWNLAESHLACPAVTEIRAYARAARHPCPDAGSVIDIGGHDRDGNPSVLTRQVTLVPEVFQDASGHAPGPSYKRQTKKRGKPCETVPPMETGGRTEGVDRPGLHLRRVSAYNNPRKHCKGFVWKDTSECRQKRRR
jgi:hypothetical protein